MMGRQKIMNLPTELTNDTVEQAILTFALNLEYLEAEYYLRATTGVGVEAHIPNITDGTMTVKAKPKVPFHNSLVHNVAIEIARDELNHVAFFREALGSMAIARPAIDLFNSFNTLARAAGLGESFDPFSSESDFLIGAFIFEDVGVSAFRGAMPLISSKDQLGNIAGILAVEAYHAGIIRSLVYGLGPGIREAGNRISKLRNTLSQGASGVSDQGFDVDGQPNLVPADGNSSAFGRSARQVLNIVYGGVDATSGLFFPNGLEGPIQ
jgi:ferritin-like protein